jgi:hypothetical protein
MSSYIIRSEIKGAWLKAKQDNRSGKLPPDSEQRE